jgi:hypothetical protein
LTQTAGVGGEAGVAAFFLLFHQQQQTNVNNKRKHPKIRTAIT